MPGHPKQLCLPHQPGGHACNQSPVLIFPNQLEKELPQTWTGGFVSYNTPTSADTSLHPSNYTILGHSLMQALASVSPSSSKADEELGGLSLDGKP